MNLYLTAAGSYVGTQADAKLAGPGWSPEEVPVDKQGLLDYLNELVARQPVDDPVPQLVEPVEIEIKAPTISPEKTTNTLSVTDQILASEGSDFGNYLSASLSRLGELRLVGWKSLLTVTKGYPHRAALERGLGFLVLKDCE